MNEADILTKIKKLMKEQHLSENALSRKCDLPQSTINSLFRRSNTPSLPTLLRICEALGVTVTQFLLSDEDDVVYLDEKQRLLLKYWNALTDSSQHILMDTACSLTQNQTEAETEKD